MKIKLASYQGPIFEGEPKKNTDIVLRYFTEARGQGAHFLCFPECFLTGYGEESVKNHALPLESEEVRAVVDATSGAGTVVLVGLAEKTDRGTFNSQVVIQDGRVLGVAHKTMLTRGYDDKLFVTDLSLPVFEAHGVLFGVAICHSTSFPEPAQALRWKGARLLFTPHYNDAPPVVAGGSGGGATMWAHRNMVLTNQAGLASLLKMVVVRSNVIKITPGALGSGDSNIWNMDGQLVAAGVPFAANRNR